MNKRRLNLLFLLPRWYDPLKDNFAKKYELLSNKATGHIFTLSGKQIRNLPISHFHFHSEPYSPSFLRRNLRRIYIQTLVPIWLLWQHSHVDAVIVYDPYSSAFAGIVLKLFFNAKLIVEINGDFHKMDPSRNVVKKWLMRLMLSISMRCADAIKVLNEDQEAFVVSRLNGKRIYRFPDFVATRYFESLESYQGDYLLSVGYPFHRKGMDVLIQAFNMICEKHKKIELRIMGYCPESEIIKYREMAGNNRRIQFVPPGWIEDVGEQLRGCYALVNAARSEALGRIHLEAMACRKPVVATRTNGGQECVRDQKTGLLCDIGDVNDLANKLDCLLSNPGMAMKMGQAGFERLQEEWVEEKYTISFVAMVEGVVEAFPRAGIATAKR